MANRQELHDKHPDSWVPVNVGDTLIGNVIDVVDAWSDKRNNLKGGYYPLLTIGDIEKADGYGVDAEGRTVFPPMLKVHAFGTVLFNEVMRKQPEVGERVRFIYRGQGEDKRNTGNPPELYSVTVAGRTDAGKRAYDSIGRAEGLQPEQVAAQAAAAVETDAQQQLGDDDIPF